MREALFLKNVVNNVKYKAILVIFGKLKGYPINWDIEGCLQFGINFDIIQWIESKVSKGDINCRLFVGHGTFNTSSFEWIFIF